MVESADGSGTIVAEGPLGGGTTVVSGDTNMFSCDSSDFYASDGNGQLVHDLCP